MNLLFFFYLKKMVVRPGSAAISVITIKQKTTTISFNNYTVLRVEEFVYEFRRYLRLKLIQPSFKIVIFRERERLYVY